VATRTVSRPHPRCPRQRQTARHPHAKRLGGHAARDPGRRGRRAGGVFHCFTETAEVARAALDLGFHISFSGILTFKNASELREVAAFVPLERCLIETDSPYLAPMPFRGKVNTPANVPLVARQLAQIKAMPVEEIAAVTSRNFERLFLSNVPRS
jgi:TatD DNase family protein